MTPAGVVLALAGRRVDAEDAAARRFPLENVPLVRERVGRLLLDLDVSILVCSAACGADLVALDEAGRLGRRRRVVVPGDRARFRKTSVIDRPGDWGAAFDRVLDAAAGEGDVVTMDGALDDRGYAAANEAILDEAQRIARETGRRAAAAVVWDGEARGDDDLTAMFKRSAEARGLGVTTVLTV